MYEAEIQSHRTEGLILTTYNVACNQITTADLCYAVWRIYQMQQNAFRISISGGYILENIVNNDLSYYGSSLNNQLLCPTTLIMSEADYHSFLNQLDQIEISEYLIRPNTKYRLLLLTNITFYVVRCVGVPIGCSTITIPTFLKNRQGILCLLKDCSGTQYGDNRCLFRALAYHKVKRKNGLKRVTDNLFKIYASKTGCTEVGFTGVPLDQMEVFCSIFNIAVKMYTSDAAHFTNLIWRPETQYNNEMLVDLTQNHVSYIKSLQTYSHSYRYL